MTKRFLLLFILVVMPLGVHAAIPVSIAITTTPDNPKPGQTVTLTATAIGLEENDAVFRWQVDGSRVPTGARSNSITVVAPPAGSARFIVVTALVNGTSVGDATLTLRPADVTIEWEGRVSTTPFYIGRPLVSADSTIVATAVPTLVRADGSTVGANNILFTWSVNGTKQSKNSGYGMQTVQLSTPFFNNSFTIDVVATSRDGTLSAEDTVLVNPVAPEIAVYEESPLGGVEETRAVGETFPFTANEVTFIAYPMYVIDPDALNFQWSLNGEPFTLDSATPRVAVFKKTGAGHGTYSVSAAFSHASRFLEKAAKSFTLTF